MVSKKFIKVKKSIIREIFDFAHKDAINLGLGEIQFDTSENFKIYAKKIIDNERAKYTSNAGILELREEISRYYESKITSKNVCVTNGAEEGLFSVLTAVLDFGDEVLISDPTFVAYESILNIIGAKPIKFDLKENDKFRINFKSLKNKLSSKTKAILINNPLNPTGTKLSKSELEKIIEFARTNKLILISDEIYRELCFEEKSDSFLDRYENSIVISGISKSHLMTGWRIGWVVSQNTKILNSIITAHQYISTCASFVSQKMAIYALSKEKDISSLKDKLRENKNIVINFLKDNKIKYINPDFAPYIFIKLDLDDYEFCKYSAKNKLIIIPGSGFGKNSRKYIRLSYGLDRELLIKGLSIFKDNLDKFLVID